MGARCAWFSPCRPKPRTVCVGDTSRAVCHRVWLSTGCTSGMLGSVPDAPRVMFERVCPAGSCLGPKPVLCFFDLCFLLCLCSVCTRSVLASSSCPGCRAVLISAVRTGGWVAASRSQSWDLPGQGQVAGVGPLLPALSIAGLVSVWRWFRGLHLEPFPLLHQVVQVHFLCCQ